jgi:hypothetical protein
MRVARNINMPGMVSMNKMTAAIGPHIQQDDGINYRVMDASGYDVAVIESGATNVIAITLLKVSPVEAGRGFGLLATMSVEEARELRAGLQRGIDHLEAQAAAATRDALRRAAGKRGAA